MIFSAFNLFILTTMACCRLSVTDGCQLQDACRLPECGSGPLLRLRRRDSARYCLVRLGVAVVEAALLSTEATFKVEPEPTMKSLRRAAYEARHLVRDTVFKNNQPAAINARYIAYQRHARKAWNPNGIADSDRALGSRFASDGYLVLPPSPTFDGASMQMMADDLLGDNAKRYEIMDGMSRLIDGVERIPKIIDAIDVQMEHLLESYYRSHFKIFGIYFYRTLPTPSKPQSSFLWHIDNCPGPEIKLMIYLDDVKADTGAFRLKDKALTNEIRAKGFRNRNQVEKVQADLDDDATTHLIEGPPGTRILFENGKVLHKATSPLREHRDIVTFVIIPSDIPWRVHYARNRHLLSTNAGACIDPRTDKPQHVGYQY